MNENLKIQSQHEMFGLASMIISSLPYPSLPVVVNQGEDGEESVASSYDLLQQAIIVQHFNQSNKGKATDISTKQDENTVKEKSDILLDLYTNTKKHHETAPFMTYDAWIEGAYDIYFNSFRAYLLNNYPSCTKDLRFYPLSKVDKDSIIMQQTQSHLRRSFMQNGANETLKPTIDLSDTVIALPSTYKDMIAHYTVDLATLPTE